MNEEYYSNGYYVPHKDSHATVLVLYEEEYTKLNEELNPNGDKKFGFELAKLFQEALEITLLLRTGECLNPECLSEGWMEENFEDLPQLNQRVFKLVESAFDRVAEQMGNYVPENMNISLWLTGNGKKIPKMSN